VCKFWWEIVIRRNNERSKNKAVISVFSFTSAQSKLDVQVELSADLSDHRLHTMTHAMTNTKYSQTESEKRLTYCCFTNRWNTKQLNKPIRNDRKCTKYAQRLIVTSTVYTDWLHTEIGFLHQELNPRHGHPSQYWSGSS